MAQERAVRTRTAILEAAALVFARRGYEAASFSEIIAQTQLTKGAVYFHFSSKRDLALATMQHKQRQLIERMSADVPDGARGLDLLAAMLRTRAAALAADESLWCVLRLGGELGSAADAGTDYAQFNEWPIRLLSDLVHDGQQAGQIRADLDPHAMGEAVFAAVLGMDALALQVNGGKDLARRTEHLIDLLRGGLGVAPRTGRKTR